MLERRKCTCLSQRANLSCWYPSCCESVRTCVSQSVGVPRFLLSIIFIYQKLLEIEKEIVREVALGG